MNDFTKEELAVLKRVLNTNIDGYKDSGLLNKIQSMIDNYCEPVCPECFNKECFKSHKCKVSTDDNQ